MEIDKTLQNKNGIEILYHTHSEEAQEIIGKMPHWIIQWGITVIAGFIILLFLIAAFVRYPETISTQIQLSPLHPSIILFSQTNSTIKYIAISDSQFVSKDQQLLITISDTSREEYALTAPKNGKAILMTDIRAGMSISKKEPLVAIIPEDFKTNDVIATGIIDVFNKKNISIGQTIDIQLASYPQESYGKLKGRIYKISPVAINDHYIFNIKLENGLKTTNDYKINLQDKLIGTGKIQVKNKPILTRLFEIK